MWASGLLLILVSACGDDAVGVDACRRIETARCQLAGACGQIDDVPACERFYRDDCLHGFGVELPGDSEIDACTRTLELAAECAREERTTLECQDSCALVSTPAAAPECAFLSKDPPTEAGRAGAPGSDEEGGSPSTEGGASNAGNTDNAGGEPAGGSSG